MFYEYIRYAYFQAFRYPKRIISLISGIAVITFCLLLLLMSVNDINYKISSTLNKLYQGDINLNQSIISSKEKTNPVTMELLNDITHNHEIESAYYFEDLTYSLEGDDFLAPWIELNNQMNLQMQPILLDEESSKSYGINSKIIYGSFFTGKPNEIILSTELLHKFISQNEVFKNDVYILDDKRLNELKSGSVNNQMNPEDIIGKKVSLYYDVSLDISEESEQGMQIKVQPGGNMELEVVGIFDPSIGYKTVGDAWMPFSVKKGIPELNEESKGYLGGQIAVRTSNLTETLDFVGKMSNSPFLIKQSKEASPMTEHNLKSNQMKQHFFQFSLYAGVFIVFISLLTTCFLVTVDRTYDFKLQQALGAGNRFIVTLFGLELFFISLFGILLGLQITFWVLWSGLREKLDIPRFMDGSLVLLTMFSIVIVVIIIGTMTCRSILRGSILPSLSRGD